MSDPASPPMTSDAFITWTTQQPEDTRHELHVGIAVSIAPERRVHALAKFHIARRLAEAVERQRLPCEVYPDGMAVEIDAATLYEPDVLVRCGPPPSPDVMKLHDPVIVVEVLSPDPQAQQWNQADQLLPPTHAASLPDYPDRRPCHHPPRPQRQWDHPEPASSARLPSISIRLA